jgi:hypothetical protein
MTELMRGAIYNEDRYRRAKLLDHSSWLNHSQPLPRFITPSDIDVYFDANGWVIFCEFSSEYATWEKLSRGQHLGYLNIANHPQHCAVLCRHADKEIINSRLDVTAFQFVLWSTDKEFHYSRVYEGNRYWQTFVCAWMRDPVTFRPRILASAIANDKQRAIVRDEDFV